MVEISLYGSGEGSGWVTAPSYSTAAFSAMSDHSGFCYVESWPQGAASGWDTIKGSAKRTADLIAKELRPRFEEQGWIAADRAKLALRNRPSPTQSPSSGSRKRWNSVFCFGKPSSGPKSLRSRIRVGGLCM